MGRKQDRLPGMEDEAIEEIEAAAEEYLEVKEQRMRLTEKEVELRTKLGDVLRKHERTDYVTEELEAHIETGAEKVKAKRRKTEEEAEED